MTHLRYTGRGPSPYVEVTYPPGPSREFRLQMLDNLVRGEIQRAFWRKQMQPLIRLVEYPNADAQKELGHQREAAASREP